MKIKLTAIICTALAIMLEINVKAASFTFSGSLKNADKGNYITVFALKKGADPSKPESEDILWVDQAQIGDDLSYSISVPEGVLSPQNTIYTNYDVGISTGNIIYVSSSGTSGGTGSVSSPVNSLAAAVDKAKESGDTIVLLDTITLPKNFSVQSDKSVTITGISPGSAEIEGGIDFTNTTSARFDLDVTFENMTFVTKDSETNRIFACGRNMVIGKGVKMTNPIDLLGGNTVNHIAENTSLTVLSGNYRRIYGGGWDSETTGDTHIVVDGDINAGTSAFDSSSNFFDSRIIGGGYNSKSVVKGNTYITFNNGTAAHIVGGGAAALVEGNTYITINGGNVMNVCGGIKDGGLEYSGNTNIVMNGGVVESIFGGSEGCSYAGNTNVTVTGGEVMRRIYGGCYNNYSLFGGWSSNAHVKGTSTVKISGNPKLMTGRLLSSGNKFDMGLFASSRGADNSSEENAVFIFTGGCYDSYKQYIGQQTESLKSDIQSYHDYIVYADTGGDVNSDGNGYISVLPDDGKAAHVDGNTFYEETHYRLKDTVTKIKFYNCISIVNPKSESTETNLSVSAEIKAGDVRLFEKGQKLIAAAADKSGTLMSVKSADINGEDNYRIDFGQTDVNDVFSIRLYVWNSEKLTPLGGFKVIVP